MYFAYCSKTPIHAVKHQDWREIDGKQCLNCEGVYKVIYNKSTCTPRPYIGKSATIQTGEGRLVITPVDFTTRQTRTKKRKFDETGDTTSGPLWKKRKIEESDDSDDDYSDVEDSEWIGITEPFKGVYSRLSALGSYAARGNLDEIVQRGSRQSRQKIKLKKIGFPVHRGGGQTAAKDGISAPNASARNLPTTSISSGIDGGMKAVVSEEWCHLWASCLGGETISDNLVAASYACNTYMMAIETTIKSRADLRISVSAYCSDTNGNVAEAIRYRIYQKEELLFDRLIDATAQHFSRADLEDLNRGLAKVRSSRSTT